MTILILRATYEHGRLTMARIVIKDLKESVELDREAMRQITGGRSWQYPKGSQAFRSTLFQEQAASDPFNFGSFDFHPDWR